MRGVARRLLRAAGSGPVRALLVAGLGLAAGGPVRAASPQGLMKEGRSAYEAGRTEEALKKFEAAARAAPPARLDPAPAEFNQGTALLKLGRGTEAEPFLEKSLRTPDLRLQSRTWYNRAHELTDRASGLAAQQKLQEAQAPLESAVSAYENAILLDPIDPDAKVNYELALRTLEELKKQIEQQKQQQQQDQQKKDQQDKKDESKDKQDKKDGQEDPSQQPQDQQKGDEDGKKDEQQKQDQKSAADEQKQDQKAEDGQGDKEQMTPEEARMLLDAMKAEEESGRERLRLRLGRPVPVDKNW